MNRSGGKKATLAKLKNLPFDKIKDWENARTALHLTQWKKLESARVTDEMIRERPEFEYWRNEFHAGMAAYSSKTREVLARVWKESAGFALEINSELIERITEADLTAEFSEGIIRALFNSFVQSYYSMAVVEKESSSAGGELKKMLENINQV